MSRVIDFAIKKANEFDTLDKIYELSQAHDDEEFNNHSQIGNTINLYLQQKFNIIAENEEDGRGNDADTLAERITRQILSQPSPEERVKHAKTIFKRLNFRGLRSALEKLSHAGLGVVSYYVVQLFYQLSVEATAEFGKAFNIHALESDHWQHIVGICTLVGIGCVYVRSCTNVFSEEYKSLMRFMRDREFGWTSLIARIGALIPAVATALLNYPKNGFYSSLALGVVVFAMFSVGMKNIFSNLSVKRALKILLLGSPALGYFISPFDGLSWFANVGVNEGFRYVIGIITALAFAAFAGTGAGENWNNICKRIKDCASGCSTKTAVMSLSFVALLAVSLATGTATSAVWVKTLAYYHYHAGVGVQISMLIGLLAGPLLNLPAMIAMVEGVPEYLKNLKHTFWDAPINAVYNWCWGAPEETKEQRARRMLADFLQSAPLLNSLSDGGQHGVHSDIKKSPSRQQPGLQDKPDENNDTSARRLSFGSSGDSSC